MAKRHDDALYVQSGACNGPAVSTALTAAYKEVQGERCDTDACNRDPAVRLILHQLCHLAGMAVNSGSLVPTGFPKLWSWDHDYQHCIDNASDRTLEVLRLADQKTAPKVEAAAD